MPSCDSCGIAFSREATLLEREVYCCSGCAVGGPCVCTYEEDLGRYPPPQYARPVSLAELLDRYDKAIYASLDSSTAGEAPSER